jgi:hypothetical protein
MDAFRDRVVMSNQFDTIDNFKAKIQDRIGIPVLSQMLVLRTTVLSGTGTMAAIAKQEQGELLLHVRDLRTMQVFIATPCGGHKLFEVVPSLPVAVLKERISILGEVYDRNMRLSFAGRELEDDRRLSDYNIQAESTVHAAPRMLGGSMPAQEQEASEDEEQEEEEDRSSQGSSPTGGTDRTASMDSLPTDSDGGLYDHRLQRIEHRFHTYVADENPHDYESDSQATTIPYIPDDLALIDFHPALCRGMAIDAGSEGVHGMVGEAGPEGEPDPSVPIDLHPALCRGRAIGTEGEGEPEGKRSKHSDGFQLLVKAVSGKTFILWASPRDTVLMQKITIFHLMGFLFSDPRDLKLIYNGKQLEDNKTLEDYNIQGETFLTLVLGVRGGMDLGFDDDDQVELQMWLFSTFEEKTSNVDSLAGRICSEVSSNVAFFHI